MAAKSASHYNEEKKTQLKHEEAFSYV